MIFNLVIHHPCLILKPQAQNNRKPIAAPTGEHRVNIAANMEPLQKLGNFRVQWAPTFLMRDIKVAASTGCEETITVGVAAFYPAGCSDIGRRLGMLPAGALVLVDSDDRRCAAGHCGHLAVPLLILDFLNQLRSKTRPLRQCGQLQPALRPQQWPAVPQSLRPAYLFRPESWRSAPRYSPTQAPAVR